MAALTVEELIAKLSPDLQGLLDSRKVHRQVQGELSKIDIDNVAICHVISSGHRS